MDPRGDAGRYDAIHAPDLSEKCLTRRQRERRAMPEWVTPAARGCCRRHRCRVGGAFTAHALSAYLGGGPGECGHAPVDWTDVTVAGLLRVACGNRAMGPALVGTARLI